jgi:hypothetical protein
MTRKKANQPDSSDKVASDDTFDVEPTSDEARIPAKGTFKPERPRDGTAEASSLHDLAQRAAESTDDLEAPLAFEPPGGDEPEPDRKGRKATDRS